MDIENQKVIIKVTNFTEKHFRNIGYDVKNGDIIEITAKELPHGSGIEVFVECNYCHKIFKKPYRRYIETKSDICCNECKTKKMMNTSLNKYGNVCSLRNPNILKKAIERNMQNLGVEYPFQSKDILDKCKNTCIEKYGRESLSPHISKAQRYLHDLFGGEINYNFGSYFLDIFLKNENICVEYDGSGHDLSVRMGYISKEKFLEKEAIREKYILKNGLKIFRIKSSSDELPSNDRLLSILNNVKNIFTSTEKVKYIYDIDNNTELALEYDEL